MKTIKEQIIEFVSLTGVSFYRLSKEAGISRAYISRIMNGGQRSMYSSNVDKIHKAMLAIDEQAAKKVMEI